MADYIYKEETDKGMNPLTVAFIGAVAGAVGTGVAMALSNPQNRRKVQKTMKDGQQWMNDTVGSLKSKAEDAKSSIDETTESLQKGADKTVKDMKA